MYSETYSQVRAYKSLSKSFKIHSGVRQGSILTRFLFNLTVDWIMIETLKNERLGIALDDTSVADLDFADDICLLEDNGPDA